VYTYSIVHQAYTAEMAREVPFVVVTVELADFDGILVGSRLVETPMDTVAIGMPVEVAWEDAVPGVAYPRFRRSGGGDG
jgi:uncharacterized OB-fold protein